MMARIAVVVLTMAVALSTFGVAVLIVPVCAVGGLPLASSCPARVDESGAARTAALAMRRSGLEAEIAVLQRRVAALPSCEREATAAQPVTPLTPIIEPAADPPPSAPPPGLDENRWRERDVTMLEGCWALDSSYTMVDGRTGRQRGVRSWKMCFDAQGRGSETQIFTDGSRCEGPISARFQSDGRLRIDENADVPCADGTMITRRRTTCRRVAGDRAECQNMHPSVPSSAPVAVTFRR